MGASNRLDMADDSIDVGRDRDLKGRGYEPWLRRALLAIVLVLVVIALLNGFGQRPQASTLTGPKALLGVQAPERLRGGLLYQARFKITARRDIKEPQLVLGPGWFDGLTINTIEPEPSQESNRNGHVALVYDELAPGDTLRVWIEGQVNPTTVGRRVQVTELDDGDRPLITHRNPLTIFP